VQGFFGKIEIAEKADQGSEYMTRFGSVDVFYDLSRFRGGRFIHLPVP